MLKIAPRDALTLAALIRSDLEAISRIEQQVSGYDLGNIAPSELDSLGYAIHNIYNALENCFKQISRSFEDSVIDPSRWHRELLEKMFLDIIPLRPAVLPGEVRPVLIELLGFRHVFRHAYDFKLDKAKTTALWHRWSEGSIKLKQALILFGDELEKLGSNSDQV